MKKMYKYLLLTLLATGSLFYSCETTELEILASPNGLSPDQADPNFLLNRIQMEYVRSMSTFNNISADLGRIDYMFGRSYLSNYAQNTLDGVWGNLYADMMPDIAAIEALHSAETDLSLHIGISKVLEGHLLMMMVDFLGDITFSEATNPTEFPTPNLDDDAAVYASAIALLDEAKGYLNNASLLRAPDLFYDSDASKWIKLANTLQMRANLTTGQYAAVVAATGVIEDTDDDFQFAYGTDIILPDNDNRHPDYQDDYRSDGANIYQNSWLIDLMVGEFGDYTDHEDFGGEGITDPRRRYYFFRQNYITPGNYALFQDIEGRFGDAGEIHFDEADPVAETLECSGNAVPTHFEFTPDEDIWCSNHLGYWGRHHGNDEGIPPDNFLRTAVGVYPAGGRFDGNSDAARFIAQFDSNGDYIGYRASINKLYDQNVGLGFGGGGAGIEPFVLASYVKFWRAEANLMLGNTGAAASHLEAGMETSIAKVMSFGSKDSGGDFTYAPDTTDEDLDFIVSPEEFVESMTDAFNDAPVSSGLDGNGFPVEKDKMDILGEQFFVAMYGGAGDAWNFIRRTGYPRTIGRNTEDIGGSGLFPRTLLYPGNEIGANPNIQQRLDLSAKVFWDSGVTNPAN